MDPIACFFETGMPGGRYGNYLITLQYTLLTSHLFQKKLQAVEWTTILAKTGISDVEISFSANMITSWMIQLSKVIARRKQLLR